MIFCFVLLLVYAYASKGLAFCLFEGPVEASWHCQVTVIQHCQGVRFETAVAFSKSSDRVGG